MRVCMVTGTLPPAKCGVGDYTDKLCSNLAKKKIEVYAVTTQDLGFNNSLYNIIPQIKKWNLTNYFKILKVIKTTNPDIVHIQYPTIMYKKNLCINLLPIGLKMMGFKVITTLHEYSDCSMKAKLRMQPNLYFSDALIIVDSIYKNDIIKNKLLKNKLIKYINIGSNITKSNLSQNDKMELRKKILGEDSNKSIIGYFGFIHKKKGLESILYSLNNLKKEGVLNSKFLIIGDLDKNNKYHLSILELINKLNLIDDVSVTGYLPEHEVANYLSITDFIVLPFEDGLSPKNGSFLASIQEGKAIITTKRKTGNLFISDNIYYLENNKDVRQLCLLIKKLQESANYIKNFTSIDNEFSWDNIAEKHKKFYLNIINYSKHNKL